MPGESVNKVCCKCEVDVSQAKRHKDAKGRYWCEPCFAKAAAEAKGGASQGKPDAASGAATPAWLAGSLAVEGKRCTACSAPMPKEGVICTSCGHNSETGKAMGTRVVMAPKEKAPKASKGPSVGGLGVLNNPLLTSGAVAVLLGALLVKSFSGAEMDQVLFMGVIWLVFVVLWVWGIILALMQSAVTALLYVFLPFYQIYFALAKCENAHFKLISLVAWGFWLIWFVQFISSAMDGSQSGAEPQGA
ncbi:MAG: hypothetical protein KF912_00405 [Phycisphaeraceae bacterium]|nr:hypothetical protein [Phycisphaeraceae bacterium]MBX3365759.1 hypothetical protein [Phycisphaeraceae bacterium]